MPHGPPPQRMSPRARGKALRTTISTTPSLTLGVNRRRHPEQQSLDIGFLPARPRRREGSRGACEGGEAQLRKSRSISAERRSSLIRVGEYSRTIPLRSTKTKVGVADTP